MNDPDRQREIQIEKILIRILSDQQTAVARGDLAMVYALEDAYDAVACIGREMPIR
jgi:hypothetical protein